VISDELRIEGEDNASCYRKALVESVSVAIEEIKPEDWAEKVYKPEILSNPEKLYKKPGYNPFE
jgi:hypothetical protein